MTPAKLQSTLYRLLLITVAYLPFHAFFAVLGRDFFNLPRELALTKEVAFVVILILGALIAFKERRFRLDLLNLAIISYIGLQLTWLISEPPVAIASGVRTGSWFLLIFLVLRLIDLSEHQKKRLAQTTVTSIGVAGALGIIQAVAIDPNWLEYLGFSNQSIPSQFLVGGNEGIKRAFLPAAGPNQFSTIMLIGLFLTLSLAKQPEYKKLMFFLPVDIAAILASYSRSAIIAMLAVLGIWAFGSLGKRLRRIMIVSFIVLTAIAFLLVTKTDVEESDFVTHGVSTSERLVSYDQSIDLLIKNPLGIGPGRVGPAAQNIDKKNAIVTESWYLQTGLETGIAGIIIFLLIIVLTAKQLIKQHDPYTLGLAGSLGAISIASLFLPSWGDSPTALAFWSLAGVYLRR